MSRPKWQLKILDALVNCFPKFQFICATHSPLVASSVKREQIIALNNFEVIPSEDLPELFSGSANEILNGIFFSSEAYCMLLKKKAIFDCSKMALTYSYI